MAPHQGGGLLLSALPRQRARGARLVATNVDAVENVLEPSGTTMSGRNLRVLVSGDGIRSVQSTTRRSADRHNSAVGVAYRATPRRSADRFYSMCKLDVQGSCRLTYKRGARPMYRGSSGGHVESSLAGISSRSVSC